MSGFILSKNQKDFVRIAADFGEKVLRPAGKIADEKGETPLDVYKQMIDIGFGSITLPKEYGGLGLDMMTQCVVTEELCRWEAGISDTVGASVLAIKPILAAGNDAQKQFACDMLQNGSLMSFGLTEPDAGSDSAALNTFAKKVEGGYILNGRKCFITNAPYADLFVIFAKTRRDIGQRGISAFIVDGNSKGLSRGKHEAKMGMRGSCAGDVVMDNVFVPDENRLGEEGTGFDLAMNVLDGARIEVGATAVGVAQSAIDYSVEYAKGRICFGRPISKLQAIRFMLADMEIQTEAARALVMAAAQHFDNGLPVDTLGAACKCFAADVAMKAAIDAVQIYSGYGYMRDYPVEKIMRDAKLLQIYEGTNQIQRVVVAGNML